MKIRDYINLEVRYLGAVSALIASIGCHALANGTGEGRNGPDTSGAAIPISADRSFDPSELQAAMTKCSIRVAQSLYQQLAKESPEAMILDSTSRPDEPSARSVISGDFRVPTVAQDGKPLYKFVSFLGFWHNARGDKFQLRIDEFGEGNPSIHDPFSGTARIQVGYDACLKRDEKGKACKEFVYRPFTLPHGFAQFGFEHSLTELVYNEYGDLVSFKAAATNLHIKTPTDSGPAMPLYRVIPDGMGGTLGPVTAITVDTDEFQNCLRGELQN